MLAGFVLAVILLQRIQSPLRRWLGFVVAVLVATFIAPVPVWLLRHESVAIPLRRKLSKEEVMTLKTTYPVKWAIYSSSLEGDCLRVSRRNYREEMTAFAQALAVREKVE